MKWFNNLPYHFGLKVRIYPNYRQKAIIKANSNTYRYWYNRELGPDYYKYDIMQKYSWGHVITNLLVKRWYDSVYNKRKMSKVKKHISWLNNKKIDSLCCNSAYLNHKQACKNYHDGLQHMPVFHAKRNHPYEWKYQTSCIG